MFQISENHHKVFINPFKSRIRALTTNHGLNCTRKPTNCFFDKHNNRQHKRLQQLKTSNVKRNSLYKYGTCYLEIIFVEQFLYNQTVHTIDKGSAD